MNLNILLKHFIYLIWICNVGAKFLDNNDSESDFVPVTRQPLLYFPQPRIVGGQDAKDNEFPYQISLRLYNNHICGGSIISENYIVTAAHCVSTSSKNSIKKKPASVITIRAGSREINSGGVVVGVSQIIVHPKYKNFNNDIALLKLANSLKFSESIQPIALATQSPKDGTNIVTTGWGRLKTDGAVPQILQYNILVSISNAACRRLIGNVPESALCLAHTAGNGVCSGDSGGPAVYNNELVGVTNFVIGQCGTNAPDGYARVSFFANWIRSIANLK